MSLNAMKCKSYTCPSQTCMFDPRSLHKGENFCVCRKKAKIDSHHARLCGKVKKYLSTLHNTTVD